ncbi:MAG: DUF1109 family protein [Acetobacteraceae bacterium]|nr:DUF1109 family protein [Acetobacteraceae bacterium]
MKSGGRRDRSHWRTRRRIDGRLLRAGSSSIRVRFVFTCPSDDPLYIAVWYAVGCLIVTLLAQTVLLRLSRW